MKITPQQDTLRSSGLGIKTHGWYPDLVLSPPLVIVSVECNAFTFPTKTEPNKIEKTKSIMGAIDRPRPPPLLYEGNLIVLKASNTASGLEDPDNANV